VIAKALGLRRRLGVRGVCGGLTIGGKIEGKIRGLGSGTWISSFPGRSNVLGVIEGTALWNSRLCNAGSMGSIVKMHTKAAGFLTFIIGQTLASV
jgi:hypothetical protein